MQVSTGTIYPSVDHALKLGVLSTDLVEVRGTAAQVEALSAAVRAARAEEKKKAARRATQRSRRANRS